MRSLSLVCLLLLLLLTACGSTSANTGTASTPATAPPSPTTQKHFQVGQAVSVGSVDLVTVTAVTTASSQPYRTPQAGYRYLLMQVTIKNTGTAEQVLSALNYTFRDTDGTTYSQVYINSNTSPWGKVEPGQQLRGQLAYEVPTTQKHFTFAFEADLSAPGETIWDIQVT